jgi:uncharacterized protein YbcC (UPF0753/DUF2309 family)
MAYLPKLFTDTFGWTRNGPDPETHGFDEEHFQNRDMLLDSDDPDTGIPFQDQVDLAEDALQALSLTDNFGRLVVLSGHGSSTVNNPYDAGLNCGACGGYSGEPNVLVGSKILNKDSVRNQLRERGIDIPDDTVFVAALHDTTKDQVSILNRSDVPDSHTDTLASLEDAFDRAGQLTRQERAQRFNLPDNSDVNEAVEFRSRDWSQVRPEWGLAGCSSFIVAPREHTQQADLEGRSFLHNYDYRQDEDFDVLELIMTAPMVVTSWINYQYYASTVDNETFGAGNKTLHNPIGKMGILEGNSGDLQLGLPWQSLHDGKNLQH